MKQITKTCLLESTFQYSLSFIHFFTKRLKSEKGAIDKALVSVLFILLSVVTMITYESWYKKQNTQLESEAGKQIQEALK